MNDERTKKIALNGLVLLVAVSTVAATIMLPLWRSGTRLDQMQPVSISTAR